MTHPRNELAVRSQDWALQKGHFGLWFESSLFPLSTKQGTEIEDGAPYRPLTWKSPAHLTDVKRESGWGRGGEAASVSVLGTQRGKTVHLLGRCCKEYYRDS